MALKWILYELKRWIMPAFVYACLLTALCGTAVWMHGMEIPLQLYLEELPDELWALIGLEKGNGQEICRQLFFTLLSIVSMIGMGIACSGIIDGIKKEEREGTLVYYLNQPWSRGNFWAIKFGAAAFRVIGLWMIFLAECLLAARFMQIQLQTWSEADYRLIFSMGIRGLGILLFSYGLCLVYCTKKEAGLGIGNYVMTVYTMMFLLGNAYKVSDLVLYYMRAAQRDVEFLEKLGGMANRMRLLYPFAYLDILHGNDFSVQIMAGYAILGGVMAAGAWIIFCRKEIRP